MVLRLMESFENKDCDLRALGGPRSSRLAPWKSEEEVTVTPALWLWFLAAAAVQAWGQPCLAQEPSATSAASGFSGALLLRVA